MANLLNHGKRKMLTLLIWTRWMRRGCGLLACAGLLTIPPDSLAQGSIVWPQISLALQVSGLDQPVHVTHAGDRSGRLFITEQPGRIRVVKGGVLLTTPFLDIETRVSCCGERGLLSVAFPPGYASKNYFYVNYTNVVGDTVVARYRVTSDPDSADPSSEELVISIAQPFANHNGGQLAFGPDGYLYIGIGDGGSGGDPQRNGQNPAALLGKMLRIDVESGTQPYAIPSSNPFVRTPGYRGEIWALGLRNPWRFSFDWQTGDLYIADVGQDAFEEVDFQPASSAGGENYGWNVMEGAHCYNSAACNQRGLVLPVAEYDHAQGCSITGGMVYRGRDYPQLQGIYFYGDYCSGRIWGLKREGADWSNTSLLDSPLTISSFGEDEAGNVYLLNHINGEVYILTDASVVMPAPAGRQSFVNPPTASPVKSIAPSGAIPVGVGPVAEQGSTLSVQIGLYRFSAPVDIYVGVFAPSLDSRAIYLLKPDNTFQPASVGIVPWKASITGPIDAIPFGSLSIAGLPSGAYEVYLAVTSAGSIDHYYFWTQSFVIP